MIEAVLNAILEFICFAFGDAANRAFKAWLARREDSKRVAANQRFEEEQRARKRTPPDSPADAAHSAMGVMADMQKSRHDGMRW